MKKYFAFAAIACAALVSCQKEAATVDEIPVAPVRDGYVEVSLTAGLEAGSKAVLDGNTVVWAVGDQVAVYPDASTTAETFTVTAVDFDAVKLSGSVPAGTESFIAVYPAAQAVSRSGNVVNMHIPDVQDLPAGGTIDPSAMSSVAYFASASAKAQFKNVFSMIEFEMSNVTGVNGVVFATNFTSTEYAPGDISVEVSTSGDVPVVTNLVGGFATTVFTNDGFASGTKYYAVVPPCPEAKDFMMIAKAGGKSGHRTSEGVKVFERNKGYNVGDALKDVAFKYEFITTGEELKEFLAEASTYTQDDEVYLGGDIDLSGITLTTAESWAGQFHGQGCSLKNWTSDGVALFGANTGLIEDFTIDTSCQLTLPSALDGAFAFVAKTSTGLVAKIINNADVTGAIDSYAAGRTAIIVGQCDAKDLGRGITIDSCVNNGNLTITGTANTGGTQYIGTIVGSMGNSDDNMLKDCTNNGKITITHTGIDTKNFYIGGVAGGTTNGSDNLRLKNTGDITFNCKGHDCAMIIAGITSYTTGSVIDCENTGAVSYISEKNIKATFCAGIAGYFASNTMSGCVNRGAVTVQGGFINGRNGIGDINSNAYVGTNAIAAGLTIGGLVSATGKNPVFENSDNHGTVTLTLTDPTDGGSTTYGTHTAARPSMGGLVGDCSGPMTNCNNYGDVNVSIDNGGTSFTGRNAGYTLYVGGIVGSSYNWSGAKASGGKDTNYANNFTLESCNNSGNVTVYTDNDHTTNHAYGGIVGWPQSEDQTAVYVARNCRNSGNITGKGNCKCRIGGIHGGTGRMEGCVNTGIIKLESGQSGSVLGSLAGFHSQAHTLTGCSAEGSVVAEVPCNALGGIVGNLGNVEFSGMEGCSVNCTLTGGPDGKTGLVVGYFNGTKTITLGTSENPIKVAGSVNGTAVTAGNYADLLCGATGYSSEAHTIYASF
jgi:hypothetical protein